MNPDPFSAPPPTDRSAAPASPDEIAALAALADREHRAGRLAAAAEAYRRILRLQPSLAEAHNNLGNVLKDQGRLGDALAHYQVAARLKPTLLAAHNNLGNICKRQRKFNEAVVAYGRALALDPNLAEVHNNLGAVLREQGHFDQGTAHLRRALALKPDYAIAHWNLGGAAKDDGRFDEARAHFDQALALDPLLAEAHWSRAMLKSFQPGDPELETLEALAADPRLIPSQRLYIEFALFEGLGPRWPVRPRLCPRSRRQHAATKRSRTRRSGHARRFSKQPRKSSMPLDWRASPTRAIPRPCRSSSSACRAPAARSSNKSWSAIRWFTAAASRSTWRAIVEALLPSAGRQAPYPDSMALLGQDDLQQLGKAYLAGLPPLAPKKPALRTNAWPTFG